MGDSPRPSNFTSPLLIQAMLDEIPEVEFAASGLSLGSSRPIIIDSKRYYDQPIDYFKRDVFEIFGLEVVAGSIESAYSQPFGLMISESFAQQTFGTKNPLNKTIEANFGEKPVVFTILGVFQDIPERSHLSYGSNGMEIIGSHKAWELIGGYKGAWNSTHMPAYLKISEGSDYKEVEKKIDEMLIRRAGEDIFYRHYLQPVWDIHLNTLGLPTDSAGDLNQVVTFGMIGILILIIACINYVNLATARVTVRMKEVGVRKVLGAGKGQFLFQFIIEAFLTTSVALLLAMGLVITSLQYFNSTFDLKLSLSLFENGNLLIGLFGVLFLVSVISGGYPGLYLSKFTSTNLLKSTLKIAGNKFSVRKLLVVFQFGISAAIIVCTIVVVEQLNFLRDSDLGYDQESIVYINLPWRDISSNGVLFKESLEKIPQIQSTSMTKGSFAKGNFSGNRIRVGLDSEGSMQKILPVDFDFVQTMGIELVEGRWFDPEMSTDVATGFVVNEAFLKYFEIDEPIGTKLSRNSQKGEIIGVAKDFNWRSKHSAIEPIVMFMMEGYTARYGDLVIKLNPGDLTLVHAEIEKAWRGVYQDRPFEWEFLDEQLEMAYKKDQVFGGIFSTFSVIAIIISCLGLLGLVSFSVERRSKEIGIRKVLGASVSGILILISSDFSRLVFLGFLISIPAAYFFISKWLENFDYRIDLGFWPFAFACVLIVVIAWLSVSYISLKAARSNPVDSLRTE